MVWQNVVDFPDLPEPDEWYFRLGIAYPERARVTGRGAGAIRYCEFSTGTFVEPITVWEEPHRLAFDVTEQAAPMIELTPYRHVHPPHLDDFLRSTQGEFRLIRLPGNCTRLEGRTWYEFQMFPQDQATQVWQRLDDGHCLFGREYHRQPFRFFGANHIVRLIAVPVDHPAGAYRWA